MKDSVIDINKINEIVKKIIWRIDSSRNHIYKIIDGIRLEYEKTKDEIEKLKKQIEITINEVDELEKKDKEMRKKLVQVSSNFKLYGEDDIKSVYEKAEKIRIQYINKQNEEKMLRQKRDSLELYLKQIMENISAGEKVISQISIALGYLEGEILNVLDLNDKNSKMEIGIMILEAQENERKRIARDIHDGPAQHMANVVMEIDICKKILCSNLKQGLEELEILKEKVKTALKEVRGIIFNLRPMSLDDLGLYKTMEAALAALENESGIEVEYKLKPVKNEIETIIQVAVFRIFQEILHNIKKHSNARHVNVKMDYGLKYLRLIIQDDGIGFDVDETLKNVKIKGNSYGLLGIIERVNQLQGEIEIKSKKGIGTEYNIKLPVNREVVNDE